MGTKNNPGEFDCYANADPDEPMFILLGRDKHAPLLVELWAKLRAADGEDPQKVSEARECGAAMRTWLASLGKTPMSFGLEAVIRQKIITILEILR